jgi:HlyD family secretion protein
MTRSGIPLIAVRRLWRLVGLCAVSAAVYLAWGWILRPIDPVAAQESGTSQESRRSAVVALARLEPAGGLISVGVRPGMRVEAIRVREDEPVSPGTILAILEGHDAAEHQRALAIARKTLADRHRGARLATAREAAKTSKTRLDEARGLYKQFGGTLKGKDRYDAELALYQVEMQSLKADLDLQLLEAARGAEAPKGVQASGAAGDRGPEDEILDAQVALAAAALKETEVRAPTRGRVLQVLIHPGELGAGTLLEMGDVSSMVATAEVYQSDVPRIRLGDSAEVDILGTRVAGKVTRIGSMVGKNRLTSVDPRALRDLRVIEVTIQLDDAGAAARYVNMEVEATIRSSAGPLAGATSGDSGNSPTRAPAPRSNRR